MYVDTELLLLSCITFTSRPVAARLRMCGWCRCRAECTNTTYTVNT